MVLNRYNYTQLRILNLLRLQPGISRSEIVNQTGLGKATVSKIISEFMDAGIVLEEGIGEQLGPAGRRPVKLRLNGQTGLAIGVELTGRECIAVLTDINSEPLRVMQHPTPNVAVDASIETIVRTVRELLEGDTSNIFGIGVGVPGPVDSTRQRVIQAENLNWFDVPLGNMLAEQLDKPIMVVQRQNAGALGEYRYGIGKTVKNLLYLSIGMGIGGGIIANGMLYEGTDGSSCEIGHITIVPNGHRCKCGNFGCLETVASYPAIVVRAKELIKSGKETLLDQRTGGLAQPITISAIIQAAQQGDTLAIDVLQEAAGYIGIAVADVINILNPSMVIIRGELTALGDLFFEPIREVVRRQAFSLSSTHVQIIPGSLGVRAGAIGAAALVIDHNFKRNS